MVRLGLVQSLQGVAMIWETPVAIDLRLGMEITMYAEHR
jgi:coenzyme PQQ precursor peptide PqqA